MGRHSAPNDDPAEDDLGGGVDLLSLGDPTPTGRHARIDAAPVLGHEFVSTSPPESAVERTSAIPLREIDVAARADSALAPVTGLPAAELLPVLPGEAVVPPPADLVVEVDGTDVLPLTERAAPPAEAPAEPGPAPSAGRPAKDSVLHRGAAASAADLALLRTDGSLRVRCVAAFLAPYVLYVVALIVAGASGRSWLVWIWIPTIVACVATGSLLDVAHRTAADRAASTADAAAAPTPDVAAPTAHRPQPAADPDTDTDGLDAEEPVQGDEAAPVAETTTAPDETDPDDAGPVAG